jgi:chromosome segregation and condensation protein ScpB
LDRGIFKQPKEFMKKIAKKKPVSLDNLAVMVSKGFDILEQGQKELKSDIQQLKQGQEKIQLKLDNVAYRFELIELQRRVFLLEKKVGIAK